MRNTDTFNKEILKIEPSTVICLYKVDLKERGGEYLFHAGENGFHNDIIFQGKSYFYYPIKIDGFEMHGDGKLPRPKMILSNHRGNISMRLNAFEDFINHKVTRIKTFLRYLDAENFPNQINPHSEPDPDVSFSEDIFYVNQKTREDDNIVEFELVSLLELQNANIPSRVIYSNYCGWQYRSNIGCGYKGKPIADQKNKRMVPSGYGPPLVSGNMVGSETYFSESDNSNSEFAKLNQDGEYPEWEITGVYNKGDVVRIEPFDEDREIHPVNIYVCINNEVKSNPIKDTENWVLDDCDKTICGCRLRFSRHATGAGGCQRVIQNNNLQSQLWTESGSGLPYGGFPGVDPYEFK